MERTDDSSLRFHRFVARLQNVLLAACGLGALGALFSGNEVVHRLLGIFAFVLIILGSRLAMSSSAEAGVKVLAIGIWCVNSLFIALFAGVHSANVVVYPLLAALCGWVLGRRWLIGLVLSTIAFLAVLAWMEIAGLMTPSPRAPPALAASIAVAVMLCVAFLTRALFLDSVASHQRLEDLSEKLREKNTLLTELNLTLEQRVESRTHELREAAAQLKSSQEGLARSERLASLGALVAGVSHELNTPIGVCVTATSTLLDITRDLRRHSTAQTLRRSQLESGLSNLTEGALLAMVNLERAARLIQSFKQVAVDQTSQIQRSFDLGQVVHAVVDSMSPTLRRHSHTVVRSIDSGLMMNSYPGAMEQVLINLVQNAYIHAFEDMKNGGLVTISAESCTMKDGQAGVRIRVSDNGCGVPEENVTRVFEPFFTTRMGRGGTGLGLSIVHSIVTDVLGGAIDVHSTPGEGTQFDIFLPLSAPRKNELIST